MDPFISHWIRLDNILPILTSCGFVRKKYKYVISTAPLTPIVTSGEYLFCGFGGSCCFVYNVFFTFLCASAAFITVISFI